MIVSARAAAAPPTTVGPRARLALLRAAGALLPAPRQRGGRRLLVIRPDHLGDLLLTTPAFRVLRVARPEAEIVALVGPWSAPVLARNPDVDRVLTYPFPWFDRRSLPPAAERFAAAGALGAWLRTLAVDTAFVARPDHWWGALAAALGGVPARRGYGFPECAPLLTHALPTPRREHAALTALRLLAGEDAARAARPGCPPTRFELSPAGVSEAEALRRAAGVPSGAHDAVLHPGASSPLKRWPPERWAAVADHLARRGLSVLLAAGPGELGELRAIRTYAREPLQTLDAAPSLDALAALLAGARVALGVDSAPMHLATAIGTPSLRLFGPGDETLFGPWGDPVQHVVIRAPGTAPDPDWFGRGGQAPHPTMLAIESSQVIAALDALLR